MAGHSKWANIQHRKGRQDAARSKLFSKLSKEITVAAKMGDPDPEKNPRLRLAVKEAKQNSVPKDVIERAIKKSTAGDPAASAGTTTSQRNPCFKFLHTAGNNCTRLSFTKRSNFPTGRCRRATQHDRKSQHRSSRVLEPKRCVGGPEG